MIITEGNNLLDVQMNKLPQAQFYLPAALTVLAVYPQEAAPPYYGVDLQVVIQNEGSVSGTHILVLTIDQVPSYLQSYDITIGPGASYTWQLLNQWINFSMIGGSATFRLTGNWTGNNVAVAVTHP